MNVPLLVVCDIDGTIANSAHRDHVIEGPIPDWQKFVSPELVAKDAMVAGARHALNKLRSLEVACFAFLTGRNEGLRAVTEKWLFDNLQGEEINGGHWGSRYDGRNGVNFYHPLIMRPTGNEEVPTSYKEKELIKLVVKYKPLVLMAFDDDPYMNQVYERFNAVRFKGPEAWLSMFPEQKNLAPEQAWRK